MALVQGLDPIHGEGDNWINIGTEDKKIGPDDVDNEVIVQELVAQTIEHLNDTINDSQVTSTDLKLHLKEHFDLAMRKFFAFRDSADPRQWEKFKGLLTAELKTAFRELCLDITNNFAANLSKAVLIFRSQVEAQVGSKCLPSRNLHNYLSDVKANIRQQFEGCAGLDLEQLTNRLDEEGLIFIFENNKRLGELHLKFKTILPDLLEKYEYLVEMVLPDDELETASEQKFVSTFRKCKNEVLKKLNESMSFDVPEMKDMFENRMIDHLGELFSEKINAAMSSKEKKLTEAGAIVNNAVDSFAKSMSTIFEQNCDDSAISNSHDTKIKDLIASITEKIYEILSDRKIAKEMIETAKHKMEDIFQEMKDQRQSQLQNIQEQRETELNSICDEFNNRLYELCESEIRSDMEELQVKRDSIISDLIRKRNSLWLDHGSSENLLELFGNDAKKRMERLSMPIFESCAKMLENNFEHQKYAMNQCLEAHKMKMEELSKEELNGELISKAKTVGANTLEQFEMQSRNIVPISKAASTQLRSDLKQAIARFQSQFERKVEDRSLMVKAEVSQLVTEVVNDYQQLMSAFSIASNYGKEKIAQIHENLQNRAQNNLYKNLKLAKYSGDVKEQQRALETMIDSSYTDTIVAVDNKRAEWNQKLDACNQKSTNHYKQMFNNSMGLVLNEEDLKKMHENVKDQAIAFWEENFPVHYFGGILLPQRRKFSKQLDNEFQSSILQMWQQINLDIDCNTKAAVERLVEKYGKQMNNALNRSNYVHSDMILSNHEQLSIEAKKVLSSVGKPKNISQEIYDDLLSSRLANTLDCLMIQNAQKKENIQVDLCLKVYHLKEAFRRNLLDLKVLPETPKLYESFRGQAQELLNGYKIHEECQHEMVEFVDEKLMEILKDLEVEWDKTQPDSNELQLEINRAVDEYNREMRNRTSKTGLIFVNSAMKKHHEKSLQIVLKKFQESVKQTSATREQFNKAIEAVLKKFEELNDLKAAENSEAAIGIDLGTTFSCVAIYKGDRIEMIPDREHHSNIIPSYVFYESATKTVVGHSAKDQSVIHPQTTIFDSKRLIGRKFDDQHTQKDITQWPFRVVRDPDVNRKEPKIEIHGKTFHPEEVSGEILKHLKRNAELHLGREVKDVVITVPAYFNDAQKRATKNAAAFANINVLEIINEPTSAAIAYSLHYTDGKSKNILVFDLGGGTFDVSVLSTEKCNIVVKAVGGDNHLGGEDFDSNMVDFCIERFRQQTGLNIPKNGSSSVAAETEKDDSRKNFEVLRRLRQKCEEAKINLSKTDKVRVVIDYIFNQRHLDVEITVKDFNEMNKLLFNKCIEVVKDTVQASKLTKSQIDDVVLVGGSSRIPAVQRLLTDFFDGKSLIMTLNPDEVVAQGAAYRAAMISGSKSRKLAGIKFQDVNPLSLGIEVIGEKFSTIIPKNTPLPTKRTKTYCTSEDFQTQILFSIYEGEDLKVGNNNLLGEFRLYNIPSKQRGQEPVDVTFECDGEGLIHVTAKVRSNNSTEDIKIQSNRGGLTEDDIRNAMSK